MSDPLHTLTLGQLRERRSLKWRHYPPDVLPLWVAEMDATLPPAVVATVRDALEAGDAGYPVPDAYVEAHVAFSRARWGWAPDPAGARLVPDVMLGIVEVLGLVTDPGDAVVVTPPVYPPFFGFLGHARRRIVEAPLGEDLRLDLDVLDAALRDAVAGGRRAALLLCSPHNPTGTVHTADELAAVAERAAAHGVRVVVDEIHAPLTLGATRFTPYLSVPGTDDAFVLTSASKAFNLAGLKAGFLIAENPALLARAKAVAGQLLPGVNVMGQVATLAAYRDGGPWFEAALTYLRANRDHLLARLATEAPVVRGYAPEGTYLVWLDFRGAGLGDDPARALLERGRVALNAGPDYGAGGAGFARFNVATSRAILDAAIDRLVATVSDARGSS